MLPFTSGRRLIAHPAFIIALCGRLGWAEINFVLWDRSKHSTFFFFFFFFHSSINKPPCAIIPCTYLCVRRQPLCVSPRMRIRLETSFNDTSTRVFLWCILLIFFLARDTFFFGTQLQNLTEISLCYMSCWAAELLCCWANVHMVFSSIERLFIHYS